MALSTALVVRSLNEGEHIGRLLETVRSQTRPFDELILVDSGSTDKTVEIAESFGMRVVHMPPTSFTFGRALNWGCEVAISDVLVFVSAHVYPLDERWLELLIAPFEDDDNVGLVYGGQTGDERSNPAELRLFDQWFPSKSDPDQQNPFCNNANCAVRRSLWERHRYDETLPGLEDIRFASEVLRDGNRIVYEADARIAHIHDEGFSQVLNRYRREAMAYRDIFGPTPFSAPKAVRLAAEAVAGDARWLRREHRLLDLGKATGFRIAQFTGAFLGHRTSPADEADIIKRMYYTRWR